MEAKSDIVQALKELNNSFKVLNNVWEENGAINELKSIANYPFEKSFNELSIDVKMWIASMIGEIELNSQL